MKRVFLSIPKSYTMTQQNDLLSIARASPGISATVWCSVMELHADSYSTIGAVVDALNAHGFKAEILSGTVRG